MKIKDKYITPIFNSTLAALIAAGIIGLLTAAAIKPVRDFFLFILRYRIPLYVAISALFLIIGPLLIKTRRYRNKLLSMEINKTNLQAEIADLQNQQKNKRSWVFPNGR